MSNEVILERKKPHFISTEFKAQRLAADEGISADNLDMTTKILKGLIFTALASVAYLVFNKQIKETRKNKEALFKEDWNELIRLSKSSVRKAQDATRKVEDESPPLNPSTSSG